ncbi:MAG: acyltransferase domain-containing protein [Gemmataceae bacterium]|nr:acyltransferase domain-containing protein [Gemmataceae bacterium]
MATAGLSLGEYTALVFAGAMSFADGLRLVRRRGEAMQAAADATPSGMLSILMLERPVVEEIVQQAQAAGFLRIANLLCPGNIVVSGEKAAIAEAQRLAEQRGARTVVLAVAGAFHTPLMKPADQALADALSQVDLRPARIPVWSNVDARPHQDPAEIRALLIRQVLEPVLWEDTLRGLLEAGVEQFHEVGPGKVLAGLLKRVQRKAECRNWLF